MIGPSEFNMGKKKLQVLSPIGLILRAYLYTSPLLIITGNNKQNKTLHEYTTDVKSRVTLGVHLHGIVSFNL